jgi:hypothetical protein
MFRQMSKAAFAMTALLAFGNVSAADPSARDFVDAIYRRYQGQSFPSRKSVQTAQGIDTSSHGAMARYFVPALVALMEQDARNAKRRNEIPNLNGDPFVGAQDWDIKSFDIHLEQTGPDKAGATVGFRNQDQTKRVVLDLVRFNEGWRIRDIGYDDGSTLRGILTGK